MDIKHFDRFVCRIPYFSLDELDRYHEFATFDEYLVYFFNKPEFREALYIASPDFAQEVDLFLSGVEFALKRREKFRISALKYITRMCSRATPFGSFSGCGIGFIDGITQLAPAVADRFRLQTRLDMGFLLSFSEYILSDKHLRKELVYFPNNTIYDIKGQTRYVEFVVTTSGERFYNLASFEKDEILKGLLMQFREGGSYDTIAQSLVSDDINIEDASEFLDELIAAKIFISELEPVMTDVSYHDQVIGIIRSKAYSDSMFGDAKSFFVEMNILFTEIETLCSEAGNPRKCGSERFKELTEICKKIPVKSSIKHYFQVDSAVSFDTLPKLSEKTVHQIEEGIRFFTKLSPLPTRGELSNFKIKFREKYGDRVVRLTEALDPDMGIHYGTVDKDMLDIAPFVDDLPIMSRPGDGTTSISWRHDFHGFLLKRIIEAHAKKETVIKLDSSLMEPFPDATQRLPVTFNAFVTISGKEENPLIYFHNIGASSSLALLGRFGYMDTSLRELMVEVAEYETSSIKEYILAEVNHLSETRIGNVMLRPAIRPWEIAYLTKSSVPCKSGQITVDDLLVTIRNDKFVLYSESLNQQILPRLSNAHNYHKDTLPIYKFLCDVQDQNAYSDIFLQLITDVGALPSMVTFIPRIQYKNFIYYPATWYFQKSEIQFVYELPDDQRIDALRLYMKSKMVPQRFYLKQGDYELLINMDNPYTMQMFMDELTNQTKFALSEIVPNQSESSAVRNSEGGFVHEILIPLGRTDKLNGLFGIQPNGIVRSFRNSDGKKRLYMPGEDWLYLKLYGGLRYNEKFLRNKLKTVVGKLRTAGLITQWFFIRYSDTSSHIRLRFKLTHLESSAAIIQLIHETLLFEIEHGMLQNLIIDSYDRELERYHPDLMDAAEGIFEADSEFCVNVLSHAAFNFVESKRWFFCLAVIDTYLKAFKLDEKQRYNYLKDVRDRFAREFNANKMQRRHLVNKYRADQEKIQSFFEQQTLEGQNVNWFFEELSKFSLILEQICQHSYCSLEPQERADYANSFIHMFLIRFIISKNRLHEYSLYSLMEQHYRYSIGLQLLSNVEA